MEYSINKLAKLAGISTRTLRYYDEIGLLSSKRISNGYRIYSQDEVDALQQILFFRALGMPLDDVKRIMTAADYDRHSALQDHLAKLLNKREQLDTLITNVQKTIAASKGEIIMSDKEKFEGFKQSLVAENEATYGAEAREKYSDAVIDASNAKMMGLTAAQYEHTQALSRQINESLKSALAQGDPGSASAQAVCALHRTWLEYFWPHYSKEAHWGLAQTYADDPRFKQYYDDIADGCAVFLRDALQIYCA